MGIKKMQIFAKIFKFFQKKRQKIQNISKKLNIFRPLLGQFLTFLASFWPFCFHLVFAKKIFFGEKGDWTPAFAGVERIRNWRDKKERVRGGENGRPDIR